MQRITDNVKARYQRKGLTTSSSTWPPFHARSFTNLALVHQKITQLQTKEDTTKIARVRTTGDIHKIPELTSSIKLDNIHQIFTTISSDDQTQCPMSILIEGHPGIGKTTLAKEMCLQWANNQLLTSDKLVLLLMLRDPNVQKITSTEQLVKYTQSTDQVKCVLSYLQNNNGVGVTLIIDGFDELSIELRRTSFFRKLIEGDVLHNVRVVVTSRPSASACLHQYVHRRIEVLGFERSSKEQYVDNALKDTPEHLHKLKAHFQQYPNIDALCYIPLNMAIIVYLCLLGSLPPTATKMYESFIQHTICRHLKRAGKILEGLITNKLEQFPPVICIALQDMQKTAFDGLVKDKILFTVKELPVFCWHDPTCYGLLQSTECYSAEEIGTPTQSFNFLHLGIQEYFAAKYVTTLPEDEVYTLLKESFIVTDSYYYPDSKSVRLSNMWILYCGITSGQCKTLRHYLTTYGKPDPSDKSLAPMFPPIISLRPSSINPSYHPVTPPTQPAIYSRYPLTPSRGQHITSYPQPYHLPTQQQHLVQYPYHQPSYPQPYHLPTQQQHLVQYPYHQPSYPQPYHLPTQQQQLVQYPYHQPLMTNLLLPGYARSYDPMSHPLTMYRPTMTHSHSSHDQMFTPPTTAEDLTSHMLLSSHMINDRSHDLTMYNPSMVLPHCSHDHTLTSPIQRYFTTTTSKQVNSNIDSQVTSEKMTGPSQQGSSSDQRISNTVTISQDVLKDPVKILYLFQCFQEAQDNELCEILSRSFHSGVIHISGHRLLPHQVVSLGFFLSRSHRKWNELYLGNCYIGDHGMNIIHQYLCGDKANKQEITDINLGNNDLTGASSHLIADIISHLQPHTLLFHDNNITNVRDISTAVINTSTVKVLYMWGNGLTAQDAVAISDMMICLEELHISDNKLGDHGAELLSEGITNTKTLRVLNISNNNIGPSGTTAIANALTNNTSLEELYMRDNAIEQDGAIALGIAITNNKMIKTLLLAAENDYDNAVDKESAMIIIKSLYNNNIITELELDITILCKNDVDLVAEEAEKVNSMRKLSNDHIIDFTLWFADPQGQLRGKYTTEHKLSWESIP